jgi:hypothetical protein
VVIQQHRLDCDMIEGISIKAGAAVSGYQREHEAFGGTKFCRRCFEINVLAGNPDIGNWVQNSGTRTKAQINSGRWVSSFSVDHIVQA